ncbi:Mov34/MPN/PAD-1 family protein [Rhizobium leguminosarum]|uniref:Mov34/MPN/PAD-1 family protein n=1 Tax=Rhizobium leguminosarum TaxID=384 RepID=UPI003F9B137C
MQSDLVFRISRDAFVLLPAKVHGIMKNFTVGNQGETEAGGILIGSYRGDHIHVHHCTVPLRRDVRTTYLFDRKDRGHQLAAMLAWTKSLGTETFVGEWHTHPEDFPTPSSTDRATWREITQRKELPVVFFIVGRNGMWAGIGQSGQVQIIDVLCG